MELRLVLIKNIATNIKISQIKKQLGLYLTAFYNSTKVQLIYKIQRKTDK